MRFRWHSGTVIYYFFSQSQRVRESGDESYSQTCVPLMVFEVATAEHQQGGEQQGGKEERADGYALEALMDALSFRSSRRAE